MEIKSPNKFRRAYGHQQAFAFGFAISMIFTGLVLLFLPNPQTEVVLGPVVREIYRVGFLAAGALLAFGIGLPRARLEASGHVLLASLFAVSVIITAETPAIKLTDILGAVSFVLPLAIGSALRAYFLVRDAGRNA